jgi:aconitate hydratase
VILEMLRRHGVSGGVGRVIEYHGPGLVELSAMDRHVIANMGAELGATTTVFPADEQVRQFLTAQGRGDDFTELVADPDATYDLTEEIDLSGLLPLIARPGSPGDVVAVAEVSGEPVYQVVVGSSANPGLRDAAIVAAILEGRQVHPQVSLDINPTSRQMLADLTAMGATLELIRSGARLHQAGCLGCIGMRQAPAIGRNSLRTFPRNFPGRSGTADDQVWLCSPETAAAAALTGEITDPRELPDRLGVRYPSLNLPSTPTVRPAMLEPPLSSRESASVVLEKAPSIGALPDLEPLPDQLDAVVAIKLGDDVSTDEILPAGAQALPYCSNIEKLAEFAFGRLDREYVARTRRTDRHVVIAGRNYGQGSSREHAAIAPRYLGLRLVLAKSYARIHWQNLANFGVLALEFTDESDYDRIDPGNLLTIDALTDALHQGSEVAVHNVTSGHTMTARHRLSPRQVAMVLAGGRIPQVRSRSATVP